MSDDSALAKLARVYVPHHKRMTKSGLVDVEGYWREIADLDLLGGKMTDIDAGVRVSGAGHHWDITSLPDSKAFEVNEDNGIQVSDFPDMEAALSHVKMRLRSARQIRDSYVPPEGRGTGEAFRYLKRMMKGIRIGEIPRSGTSPAYFSSPTDRLIVKMARKVYVPAHKRVTAKGTVDVEGYWRELPVATHPRIPHATYNPKGFKPGVMHEGPIVTMRVPGQSTTVERGETYQWTEYSGEVKTGRFTGEAAPVSRMKYRGDGSAYGTESVDVPIFRDVDTGETLIRSFEASDKDYMQVTKLEDSPTISVSPIPATDPNTPESERDIEGEIMNSELVDQTGMVDDFLDRFKIPKSAPNRERMRDLLIRQGPSQAEKTLKAIHSKRVIIGGPPMNRRQLQRY